MAKKPKDDTTANLTATGVFKATTISAGETVSTEQPSTVEKADATVQPSDAGASPSSSDAPQSGATAGNQSSNDSAEHSVVSGTGNAAGPAGAELQQAVNDLDLDRADKVLSALEEEFQAKFPRFFALVDSWQAENGRVQPKAVRVVSKVDGFRRGGIGHPKAPTDHPVGAFVGEPEIIEAWLSEPNLTVKLI